MSNKIILIDKEEIPTLKSDFVGIKEMKIKDNDNLSIEISFYGGCKDHLFRLFGFFDDHRILNLFLEHDSNDDQCKMIVRKELLFDLSPIKNNYQLNKQNKEKDNSLILKLKNRETKYVISR